MTLLCHVKHVDDADDDDRIIYLAPAIAGEQVFGRQCYNIFVAMQHLTMLVYDETGNGITVVSADVIIKHLNYRVYGFLFELHMTNSHRL